jgi:hypothetical protein
MGWVSRDTRHYAKAWLGFTLNYEFTINKHEFMIITCIISNSKGRGCLLCACNWWKGMVQSYIMMTLSFEARWMAQPSFILKNQLSYVRIINIYFSIRLTNMGVIMTDKILDDKNCHFVSTNSI